MTPADAIAAQYQSLTHALQSRDPIAVRTIVSDQQWVASTLGRLGPFAEVAVEIDVGSVKVHGTRAEVTAHYSIDGVPKTAPGVAPQVSHTATDVVDVWIFDGKAWRLSNEQESVETQITN